jgi:hypothetical protein
MMANVRDATGNVYEEVVRLEARVRELKDDLDSKQQTVQSLFELAQARSIRIAELEATGPERDLADSLAQARLIAEECLADIDTTFRLNVDMRDHTAQVCLQAQKNGVRFVLKRLIEHGTRADVLALLREKGGGG